MLSIGKNHLACETATPGQRAAALPWLIVLIGFKLLGILSLFVIILLYFIVKDFSFAVVQIGLATFLLSSCLIEPFCFWKLNRIEGTSQSSLIRSSLIRFILVSCFVGLITSSLWHSR